jgi:hypothetical protein
MIHIRLVTEARDARVFVEPKAVPPVGGYIQAFPRSERDFKAFDFFKIGAVFGGWIPRVNRRGELKYFIVLGFV